MSFGLNITQTEIEKGGGENVYVKGANLDPAGEVIVIEEVKVRTAYKENDDDPDQFELMLVEVDYGEDEPQRLITLGTKTKKGNASNKQRAFINSIIEMGWEMDMEADEDALLKSINEFIGDGLRLLFRPTKPHGDYNPSIDISPAKAPKERKPRRTTIA